MIDDGGPAFEQILDHCNATVTVSRREIGANTGGITGEPALSSTTDVPAIVQPVSSAEVLAENGILVSSDVTFYLPQRWAGNTLSVSAIDTVTASGTEYQIIGNPVQEAGVGGWLRAFGRVRS